jgi:hypothetical protein
MGTHALLWPSSDLIHCAQAFNSLGQSPCDVTAYMMSTCNRESELFSLFASPALWSHLIAEYKLGPLSPGYVYSGPGRPDHSDTANLCLCSTVGYSLFSACGACQGRDWMKCGYTVSSSQLLTADVTVISWSEWIANCTKTLPPGS